MLITKFPAETKVKDRGVDLKIKKVSDDLNNESTEGVLIVNKHWIIQNINPGIEGIFSYVKKEVRGESINLLFPEFQEDFRTNLNREKKQTNLITTTRHNIELTGLRKGGVELPLCLSINYFNAGNQSMAMILVSNANSGKQSENSLFNLNSELEQQIEESRKVVSDSQYLFKMIARNFPNGIISVLDRDFNYVYLTDDLQKEDLSRKLKDGNSFLHRIEPAKRFDIKRKLLAAFNGENSNFEVNIDEKVFMVNAVGLRVSGQDIKRILLVTQDITHLKNTEKDILNSLEKEKHLNEMKSQFVSMASHEFRSPLTAILNSTTILSKLIDIEGSEQGVQRQVDRIKSTINQLKNVLNDFLSVGRLDEGKLEMNISEVNILECTSKVLDEFRSSTKPGQQIEYHHKGRDMASLDCNMLKNIYHNLISNAIKYSSENDTIRIETMVEGDQLKLIVQDEGIGIPKKEQKNVFERFFRAENAANIKGIGLGLNIVKKYVETVNGNIKFFSIPNKGTTFIIDLPLVKSEVDLLNLN